LQANNASLYIQVDGDTTFEGMRCYFKRSSTGISGWILYHYDQNTPNIRIIDEDDDPPYIAFQTIGSGTLTSPQYDNRFGSRGPVAGATTGFKWDINGTTVASLDSQWFQPPIGTTVQRPGTPSTGMIRFNSTISGLENYDGNSWQQQVFGTYFSQSSSDGESTTTSTTWQQKLRHTVSGLIDGTYRLAWYSEIRCSTTNSDVQFRIQQNDVTDLALVNIEPQDATSYFPNSGFIYLRLSPATTYNFDMDYSNETAGNTVYIRRARFEFWRVP